MTKNSLKVSAEYKKESKDKMKNYLRKEQLDFHYETISLTYIVASQVKAKFSDGVLNIILPKLKSAKIQSKKFISIQYFLFNNLS
jgi:HSP20 family molecular chaperone IbpA